MENFATGEGTVLIGGFKSQFTTEIVKQPGLVEESFTLKDPALYIQSLLQSHLLSNFYFVSSACGGPLPHTEELLLTGLKRNGMSNVVSVYNISGWVKDIAKLNVGRSQHTCGGFMADDGFYVKIINLYPGHIYLKILSTSGLGCFKHP